MEIDCGEVRVPRTKAEGMIQPAWNNTPQNGVAVFSNVPGTGLVDITAQIVAEYYAATYTSMSNVSAVSVSGGYNVSYTANTTGNSYTDYFVSTESIATDFAFLDGLYGGNYSKIPSLTVVNFSQYSIWVKPENNKSLPVEVPKGGVYFGSIDGFTHPAYPMQIYKVIDYIPYNGIFITDKSYYLGGILISPAAEKFNEMNGGGWKSYPCCGNYFDSLFEKAGVKIK